MIDSLVYRQPIVRAIFLVKTVLPKVANRF